MTWRRGSASARGPSLVRTVSSRRLIAQRWVGCCCFLVVYQCLRAAVTVMETAWMTGVDVSMGGPTRALTMVPLMGSTALGIPVKVPPIVMRAQLIMVDLGCPVGQCDARTGFCSCRSGTWSDVSRATGEPACELSSGSIDCIVSYSHTTTTEYSAFIRAIGVHGVNANLTVRGDGTLVSRHCLVTEVSGAQPRVAMRCRRLARWEAVACRSSYTGFELFGCCTQIEGS